MSSATTPRRPCILQLPVRRARPERGISAARPWWRWTIGRTASTCPSSFACCTRAAARRNLIEGGGRTVSMFLEANLLDRLQMAIAPLIIGEGRPGDPPAAPGIAQRVPPPWLPCVPDRQRHPVRLRPAILIGWRPGRQPARSRAHRLVLPEGLPPLGLPTRSLARSLATQVHLICIVSNGTAARSSWPTVTSERPLAT